MPEPPVVAEHWAHLIEWFWDISSARQSGFGGPSPISFTDIANWSALTGTIVTPDDVATIRAMDAAFLSALAKERAEAEERARQKKD